MILYTFSSEYIEKNGAEYINYEHYYKLKKGDEYEIESYEKYLLFLGNGYVSFGGTNYIELNLDSIKEFTLPYNLNNKYYKLSGEGNTLEILSTSNQIEVYVNNYKCIQKCEARNKDVVNVINWYNAKKENLKLLFVNRKTVYSVNLEKGDKVKYLLNQNFTFQITSSLAQNYYDLDEGILAVYGKPNLTFSNIQYNCIEEYSSYQLYYIKPYNNSITIKAQTNSLSNEITIEGLDPTISITFPETWYQKINKGLGPQYLRITINSEFADEFIFDFGTNVIWFEGKMFTDQGSLNKGESKTNVKISKENAGKTYTAVYNSNSGTFKATKIINWIELKEYEYKKFEISEGEEKAFKYTKGGTSSTLIKF